MAASAHMALAITQITLYAPIVPLTIYSLTRNWHHRPRQAWIPLVVFSCLRLTGGTLLIALQYNPSDKGLIVSAVVFLNVGVVPLLISTLGLLRIVLSAEDWRLSRINLIVEFLRASFIILILLLVIGGSLNVVDKTDNVGMILGRTAYVLFLVVIAVIAYLVMHLYRERTDISPAGLKYVFGTAFALPLVALRTIYGVLAEFDTEPVFSTWNPVFGSAVAFGLMVLFPEYIVLLAYSYLGFLRMQTHAEAEQRERAPSAPGISMG